MSQEHQRPRPSGAAAGDAGAEIEPGRWSGPGAARESSGDQSSDSGLHVGRDEELHEVTLRVNGRRRSARVPARRLLSDFLRHDLGLTGTHVGCEHGVCGCCTVLLAGEPVRSCLLLAVSVRGAELTTVEGLAAEDGTLHPVQQAFAACHGLQCGFCTPGFVMSVCGLLAEHPDPDDEVVLEGLAGNLCRCTGYQNIVAAVHDAAERFSGTGADPRERHRPDPAGAEGTS